MLHLYYGKDYQEVEIKVCLIAKISYQEYLIKI